MSRAHYLLETSGLDAQPAENTPALAPQMSSPPENDLQNNPGYETSHGSNYMINGRVVNDKPRSTQLRNAGISAGSDVSMKSPDRAGAMPYESLIGDGNQVQSLSKAQYLLQLCDEAALKGPGPGQILPYSNPNFAAPHPQKTQLRQSSATQYSNRLRSIQRDRFFRKAISASWKKPKPVTPNLTPSMQQSH